MENTEADLMVGTGQIEMIPLEMLDTWIRLIYEAVDMGFTLVLVQTGTTVIITIILTRCVTGDIYQMGSRKKIHLHLMEK